MRTSEDATMLGSYPVLTAFWAGLAAPVYLYVPPAAYPVYGAGGGVGSSIAAAWAQLGQAMRVAETDPVDPAALARPVPAGV